MAIVRADALRSVAFGAITNSYTSLGAALAHNWRMFRIINNTDGSIMISFDASTDNLFLPAYSFVLYDLSTNATPVSETDNFLMQIGTQFSIKYSSAPSVGSVYVEGIYGKGE